jgi:hypothetical protein
MAAISFADIAVGTSRPQTTASGGGVLMAWEVTSVQRQVTLSGFNVVNQGAWNTGYAASIVHDESWKQVGDSKIVSQGSWVDTSPTVVRTVTKKRVKFSTANTGEQNPYAEPSIANYGITPTAAGDNPYVPAGWKIVRCYLHGIYDDLLDGIFMYRGGVESAFVLARKEPSTWVGRFKNGWDFTDYQWVSIPDFTIDAPFASGGLRTSACSNWYCPYIMTTGEAGGGCGSDGCTRYVFLGDAHETTGIPVDMNRLVSVKTGGNPGDTLNHYFFVQTLVLEEP